MTPYSIHRTEPTIWREGAKDEEIARVAEIDGALDGLERARFDLVNERRIITNRACQRGRARRSVRHGDTP